MIVGTSYGFEPHKIIDVVIDGISYKWSQSDIVKVMMITDTNVNDRYKVCYIKSVFRIRQLARNYKGLDMFRVIFTKDYDGETSINIPDMITLMRQIKLNSIMGEREDSNE